MANFIPSKKVASDFNKGNQYNNGDGIQAETINNLVEGLLHVQENGGEGKSKVTSVNGQTGDVHLDAQSIGLGNVDDVRQYSQDNPPPYPVTSVNGQTGDVHLDAQSSGLFRIPYDLDWLDSDSEGIDFIIENIEEIKKGAYFVSGNNDYQTYLITRCETDNYGGILLAYIDDAGGVRNDNIQIHINKNKQVSKSVFSTDLEEMGEDYPYLMQGIIRTSPNKTARYNEVIPDVVASPENNGAFVAISDGKFIPYKINLPHLYRHTIIVSQIVGGFGKKAVEFEFYNEIESEYRSIYDIYNYFGRNKILPAQKFVYGTNADRTTNIYLNVEITSAYFMIAYLYQDDNSNLKIDYWQVTGSMSEEQIGDDVKKIF